MPKLPLIKQIYTDNKHLTLASKLSYLYSVYKLYVKYHYYRYFLRKYKKRLVVVTYRGYSDWDKVIPQYIQEKRLLENKITWITTGESITLPVGLEYGFTFYRDTKTPYKSGHLSDRVAMVDAVLYIKEPIQVYTTNSVKAKYYVYPISSLTMRPASRLERELVE